MYIFWASVRSGKTAIYEIAEEKIVYVVTNTGVAVFKAPATEASISQLANRNAIYIFDAKANSMSEPVRSEAFLVEFSSRNSNSYKQTRRRECVFMYCIPSYTADELTGRCGSINGVDFTPCGLFGVDEAETRRRCSIIGPSIRYVLAKDFNTSEQEVNEAVKSISPNQMQSYMEDTSTYKPGAGSADISACLLILIVHEEEFDDAKLDDAYADGNVEWKIASKYIAEKILDNIGNNATEFVRNFITEVGVQNLTKMKGIAGNYLELVVPAFIEKGSFSYRKLQDNKTPVHDQVFQWQNPVNMDNPKIYCIGDALVNCRDTSKLYVYCGNFPALDMSAMDFYADFQITASDHHTIHLLTILTICDHVRNLTPEHKVQLFFVVPKEVYPQFKYTQSFKFYDDITKRDRQAKFAKLPKEIQARLSNLEQYVACYNE